MPKDPKYWWQQYAEQAKKTNPSLYAQMEKSVGIPVPERQRPVYNSGIPQLTQGDLPVDIQRQVNTKPGISKTQASINKNNTTIEQEQAAKDNYIANQIGGTSQKLLQAVKTLGLSMPGEVMADAIPGYRGSFMDQYLFPSTPVEDIQAAQNNPLSQNVLNSVDALGQGMAYEMAGPAVGGLYKNAIKPIAKEIIYRGVNPVGYGIPGKIKDFVPNLVKYSINPKSKVYDVGLELNPFKKEIKKLDLLREGNTPQILNTGKNRLDAWRLGLGLKQKYNTFTEMSPGLYRINQSSTRLHRNPLPYKHQFSYTNAEIEADAALNRGHYVGEDFPWQRTQIIENSPKSGFDKSIYYSDDQGIMGQYRMDVGKTPEGNLHYQANDYWDLTPFRKRTGTNIDKPILSGKGIGKEIKSLRNIEMLRLVGGKPFHIQNNYIVNPKDLEVLKHY